MVDSVVTEKYLWAGLTTLLATLDASDKVIQRFEYAGGRMPAKMVAGGATYYLTYDQVGSLRTIVDAATGMIVKQIDYDSFGNILSDTNAAFAIPFGFAGGLHDPDTGLVRFGFRDFNADVGRWTAKDPIRFAAGDTDLYGYALDSPVNFTDATGTDIWDWFVTGEMNPSQDVLDAARLEFYNSTRLTVAVGQTINVGAGVGATGGVHFWQDGTITQTTGSGVYLGAGASTLGEVFVGVGKPEDFLGGGTAIGGSKCIGNWRCFGIELNTSDSGAWGIAFGVLGGGYGLGSGKDKKEDQSSLEFHWFKTGTTSLITRRVVPRSAECP